MAGTLTISQLSDGVNSTSSTNCIQGSAKAWVTYKGTATQSIRKSYNVSSVTYVSTGQYTVNFTNAFADANYCMQGSANWGTGGEGVIVLVNTNSAPTASSSNIVVGVPGTAGVTGLTVSDANYVYVAFLD